MLITTLADLGGELCEVFDIPYKEHRVRMCDREHLMGEISVNTDKLVLPMLSYSVDGIGESYGGRLRGYFRGETNETSTVAQVYRPLPVKLTIRLGIYCASMQQAIDAMARYYSLAHLSQFVTTFYHGRDEIKFEYSIGELEDLTVPPSLKDSRPFEEKGLLYVWDGGFTLYTNILYDEKVRLIRATHLDVNFVSESGAEVGVDSVDVESALLPKDGE